MKIFITGGSGFIGSHLAEFHLNLGDEVQVIDDLTTGRINNISFLKSNQNFTFHKANILSWKNLKNIVAWADRIYHMAAVVGVYRVLHEPLKVFSVNIGGTQTLLNTIISTQSCARVIMASTSSVYGHSPKTLLNEKDTLILQSHDNPLKNYALSKMVSEELSLACHRMHHMQITIIRLFNTIGPRQTGDYGMVVPRFIQQARAGKPITVFGDGTQTRSFCDVRDTVSAIHLLSNNKKTIGEVINVGNDQEISMIDLAKLIKEKTKSDSEIQYIPFKKAYGHDFSDITHRRPDLTKLHQLINFKHQWTLNNTIDDLITRSG